MHINNLIYVSYIKNINSKKILTNTFLCLDGKIQGTGLIERPAFRFFNMFSPVIL